MHLLFILNIRIVIMIDIFTNMIMERNMLSTNHIDHSSPKGRYLISFDLGIENNLNNANFRHMQVRLNAIWH